MNDASSSHPSLIRAIGRWSLAALMLNIVIGSGILACHLRWLGCWAAGVRWLLS